MAYSASGFPLRTSFMKIFSFLLIISMISGCASSSQYRVVKIGPGVDDQGIIQPLYGVTRNNVIIPEYVVDEFGKYPASPEEAKARFETRKDDLEDLIQNKYEIPTASGGGIANPFFAVGFILLAPIVLPVTFLGELLSGKSDKKSAGELTSEYFDMSLHPPAPVEKARIKERVDIFY